MILEGHGPRALETDPKGETMAEPRAHRTRWGSAARANAAFVARLAELEDLNRVREVAASTELEWLVMPSRYQRMSGKITERAADAATEAA